MVPPAAVPDIAIDGHQPDVSGGVNLLVVVPSRLGRNACGRLFLSEAIDSIAAQRFPADTAVRIEIAIGVDPRADVPDDLSLPANATVARAASQSQAAALNAAATAFHHDFLAILEDDDQWLPDHLGNSLAALRRHAVDFVSTTQLQVDESGEIASIFDFPTPSGWVMRREVWHSVGPFDDSYRYHLDNEWLGRLATRGVSRGHLVESTAPVDGRWMAVRPWLKNVLTQGGPRSTLLRHGNPVPNVRRLIHGGSGMSTISHDPIAHATSTQEYERLSKTYGRIPW
jgi:hypothetical protein